MLSNKQGLNSKAAHSHEHKKEAMDYYSKLMKFIYHVFKYIYIAVFFYVTPWIIIIVPYILEKRVKIALSSENDAKTAEAFPDHFLKDGDEH